ncbi:cytochrome P450 [Mycena leptocephala]|nr:cytochrome P450 [Mycena leptocephala]
MTSQFLIPLAGTLGIYAVYRLVKMVYTDYTSPLRDLPGPKGGNFIIGHFRQTQVSALSSVITSLNSVFAEDSTVPDKWREEFGPNYQLRGFLGKRDLYTTDTKALNHILVNDHLYQKGLVANKVLTHILGNGLLSVETAEHKLQRKILNPAFGVPQIRELTEIFNKKSSQAERQAFLRLVQAGIPILSILPSPGGKTVNEARAKMVNIAKKLLADSRANIKAGEKAAATKRDLLSLMVQSNMSPDIREHLKLSDADVIAQIPTFFVAGHETTSVGSACSFAQSIVQAQLREELLSFTSDDPTMDELNALPYLENVIREAMRLYPPVGFSIRVAMVDDLLPLSKQYVDSKGRFYDHIPIPKGTTIRIPISAVHRDKEIWGDDADTFRYSSNVLEQKASNRDHPSQARSMEQHPDAASAVPSVWANLLTFLAGPHNCIGFRFSLVEIKSLLFTLVRAFEFEPAVPEDGIGFSASAVRRPNVIAEPEAGNQLPLIVRPYVAS